MVTRSDSASCTKRSRAFLRRANSSASPRIIHGRTSCRRCACALRCEWADFLGSASGTQVLVCRRDVETSTASPPRTSRRTLIARQLTMSEGTAGHVWRSRKTTWTTDIVRDMCLPRCVDAKQAGLQGGVWVPLKTVNAVYGVLELLGRHPVPARADRVVAVEQLAVSLGCLIEAALFDGLAPTEDLARRVRSASFASQIWSLERHESGLSHHRSRL